MERFEYKVVSLGNVMGIERECEDRLNRYGAEGWELICVEGVVAYFKRTTHQAYTEFQAEVLDRWGMLSGELELESG